MDGANIIDYLKWRGDLSFGQTPFNDIDSLILSQIIYIPFEEIVPSVRSMRTITLKNAAEKFFDMYDETKSSLGALLPRELFDLFRLAGESVRFRDIRLSRYVNKINHKTEIQFCAMTIFIDELNEVYIDFRGTDDTIVGWKEDFNMGFKTPVPSQKESVKYFSYVINRYVSENPDLKIRLGGHSKGGNLAAFAAMFVLSMPEVSVQDRIECVYNFDGPGFDDKVLQSKEYMQMREKIKTIIPQSSVVGMLLGHEEGYTVVKSNQVGLLQHDALSWEVVGTKFTCLESVTDSSIVLDKTLKAWIKSMDSTSAERFVTVLFEILSATDARTLTELMTGKNRSLSVMMKAYAGEDEDTKKMLKSAVRSMIDIWKRNIRKKI